MQQGFSTREVYPVGQSDSRTAGSRTGLWDGEDKGVHATEASSALHVSGLSKSLWSWEVRVTQWWGHMALDTAVEPSYALSGCLGSWFCWLGLWDSGSIALSQSVSALLDRHGTGMTIAPGAIPGWLHHMWLEVLRRWHGLVKWLLDQEEEDIGHMEKRKWQRYHLYSQAVWCWMGGAHECGFSTDWLRSAMGHGCFIQDRTGRVSCRSRDGGLWDLVNPLLVFNKSFSAGHFKKDSRAWWPRAHGANN